MKGPGLLGMFTDLITGNSDETNVLKPDCLGCGPGGSLVVSDAEKANAVREAGGEVGVRARSRLETSLSERAASSRLLESRTSTPTSDSDFDSDLESDDPTTESAVAGADEPLSGLVAPLVFLP